MTDRARYRCPTCARTRTFVNAGSGWSCRTCGHLLHTPDGKPEGRPTSRYRRAGWTMAPRSGLERRMVREGLPEPRRRPLASEIGPCAGVPPCTRCLSRDFTLERQSAKRGGLTRTCVPCRRRRDREFKRRARCARGSSSRERTTA